MRIKRKKMLYAMFLLITVLMFLQGWEGYMRFAKHGSSHFAKKHQQQQQLKKHKLQKHRIYYQVNHNIA